MFNITTCPKRLDVAYLRKLQLNECAIVTFKFIE